MSKQKHFSLSDDERSILQFLWRVKVASSSAIFLRFESDFRWKEGTAYKRLLILRRKGYVDRRADASVDFRVWTLTAKGFKAIKHLLLPLKEEGYGSESIMHDLHVLAAHYGEWIPKGAAPDVRFVTEQELRRTDEAELPNWAKPFQSHKPDGIWYFPESTAKTLLALEVEISRKRTSEYVALGSFYSEEKSVCSVLWIVQGKSHASSIVTAFQSTANEYRNIHNFVTLDDFKKSGWASVIFFGPDAGVSIHNFLEKARHQKPIRSPSELRQNTYVGKLLDFRICGFDSSTSASARNSKFRA
jgi:hypothetical protein